MTLRLVDWIWHIEGSVALAPGQSNTDAFARLDPLFRHAGTRHELTADTLTFRKKDQAAQDRMSIFDHGVLRIADRGSGPELRYRLSSRTLLLCFLAPLLFLGIAQLTLSVAALQKPATKAEMAKAKASANKKARLPMNPLDMALGAPAPEDPAKKDKKDEDKKPTPTSAYVFSGIFATLYVVGRLLEDRLVRGLFRRSLSGS